MSQQPRAILKNEKAREFANIFQKFLNAVGAFSASLSVLNDAINDLRTKVTDVINAIERLTAEVEKCRMKKEEQKKLSKGGRKG